MSIPKKFESLKKLDQQKKIKSNINYYFVKNFSNDNVKTTSKKEYKNGTWIEFKEFEVIDEFTNKKYIYNFSCKYALGEIIKSIGKHFIKCLYVSKFKVKIIDL